MSTPNKNSRFGNHGRRPAEPSDPPEDVVSSRRRLLKTVAVGGGAIGLTSLPGKWSKPTVASVILPAHAQTSGCVGTLANCPDGYLYSTTHSYSGTNVKTAVRYSPSITIDGNTRTGEYHGSGYSNTTACASPCDLPGTFYFQRDVSYGGGHYSYSYVKGIRCGDQPVERVSRTGYGISVGGSGYTVTYTFSSVVESEQCTYLAGF